MLPRTLGPQRGGLWDPTLVVDGNETFLIRVWKPLPNRHILKPWGWRQYISSQSGQYLSVEGLGSYTLVVIYLARKWPKIQIFQVKTIIRMLWAFLIRHFMLKSLRCVSRTHGLSQSSMLSLFMWDYVPERKESVVGANREQQDYNLILTFHSIRWAQFIKQKITILWKLLKDQNQFNLLVPLACHDLVYTRKHKTNWSRCILIHKNTGVITWLMFSPSSPVRYYDLVLNKPKTRKWF